MIDRLRIGKEDAANQCKGNSMKCLFAMKRNSAVELLRVLMMFGICLGHAIWQCGYVPKCHVGPAFLISASLFWAFRQMRLPSWLERVSLFLSPQ